MENNQKKLFYVPLAGMEVYLATCFFRGMQDRPRNLHIHPCYELICVEKEEGMSFTIIPPLYEHIMADVPIEQVSSLLFSFLSDETEDICMALKKISQPVTIQDTFGGKQRILSLKELTAQNPPGAREQIAAELRLLFILLARSVCEDDAIKLRPVQTLEEERMALLEEYFNIQLKDADCSKQQLAEQLGVCERQLTRILKEIYHSNFSSILLRSRMNLAQAMLEQEQKSLEEIAEAVGYASPDTFKRAYKKFFGYPPRKGE